MATFKVRMRHKDHRRIIMEIGRLCVAGTSLHHMRLRYFLPKRRRERKRANKCAQGEEETDRSNVCLRTIPPNETSERDMYLSPGTPHTPYTCV